jgi:hypothetical protein
LQIQCSLGTQFLRIQDVWRRRGACKFQRQRGWIYRCRHFWAKQHAARKCKARRDSRGSDVQRGSAF